MKRGLVIGKFMPLHKGHIALIQLAAQQCDEVILFISCKADDPIPGSLRFEWIKEEFARELKIKPEISHDDFDEERLSWDERIVKWAGFLRKRFPAIDCIFSSAEYGSRLAKEMGTQSVSFDISRKLFSVSGALIREKPFKYWDFICSAARPWFVKKICFYGPESTGKSTLARRMAEIYMTEFVPEVSREFISSNEFTVDDILRIGRAQTARALEKTKTANKLLFCDTDLITTQIYCRHYLNVVPPELVELEKKVVYDQYFLFEIDIPWVADGLRDLGERRREMYDVFKQELIKRGIVYTEVNGNFDERSRTIQNEVNQLLASLS